MRSLALALALAVTGCATGRAGSGGPAEIRAAVRAELLAITGNRASGSVLDQKLVGAPSILGAIDYTNTSKTNHEATTPFNNTGVALCGKTLLLQPTTDVYVIPVTTNIGTVTSSTGVLLFANERVQMTLLDASTSSECWIAAIRSSVSGNLRVWELR